MPVKRRTPAITIIYITCRFQILTEISVNPESTSPPVMIGFIFYCRPLFIITNATYIIHKDQGNYPKSRIIIFLLPLLYHTLAYGNNLCTIECQYATVWKMNVTDQNVKKSPRKKAAAKKATRKAAPAKKAPKLGRLEWVEAAFKTLTESGVTSIHVETLAKRLGVTKGSFYWHFKDRTELLEAVLEKWQEQYVIARVETMGGGPDDRLLNLLNIVPRQKGSYQHGGSMELAMRSWARTDDNAMGAVEKVDRTRVDFVCDLFESRGHTGNELEARAFLTYAYIMCQGIFSFDKQDDILERIHPDILKILMQPLSEEKQEQES